MKKNKNKEIIINSINDEFDGKRKKINKKELKNMISLEDFILKYYNRYNFVIVTRICTIDEDDYRPNIIFEGRFNNDIEVAKFVDEYNLDCILLNRCSSDSNRYISPGWDCVCGISDLITISIYSLILKDVI